MTKEQLEEEELFIESLKGKLDSWEYDKLLYIFHNRNMILKQSNNELEREKYELEATRKKVSDYWNRLGMKDDLINEAKVKYNEVISKYARLEIEHDILKEKVRILQKTQNSAESAEKKTDSVEKEGEENNEWK